MPRIEDLWGKLFPDPKFGKKILIGGFLTFIPIVFFFPFGYLYRYSLQVRQKGEFLLPDWKNWPGLFRDGFIFFVLWLLLNGVPLVAAFFLFFLLRSFFVLLQLPLLGWIVGYLPVTAVLLAAPVLFATGLYRYQKRRQFKDLLPWRGFCRQALAGLPCKVVPTLALTGLTAAGWSIYGFTLFAGALFYLPYLNLIYIRLEQEQEHIRPAPL